MHERGLHVHRQHDAEPDEVDAECLRRQHQQRHHDEGELEEIEEEGEQEDQEIDGDQEADGPPGSPVSRSSTHRWPLTP